MARIKYFNTTTQQWEYADKVGISHNHNDLYYTETEIDAMLAEMSDEQDIYVQEIEPTDAEDGALWIDTANDPSFVAPNLPEVTTADNGKVLMVVDGRWQAVNLNLSVDADGNLSI